MRDGWSSHSAAHVLMVGMLALKGETRKWGDQKSFGAEEEEEEKEGRLCARGEKIEGRFELTACEREQNRRSTEESVEWSAVFDQWPSPD